MKSVRGLGDGEELGEKPAWGWSRPAGSFRLQVSKERLGLGRGGEQGRATLWGLLSRRRGIVSTSPLRRGFLSRARLYVPSSNRPKLPLLSGEGSWSPSRVWDV